MFGQPLGRARLVNAGPNPAPQLALPQGRGARAGASRHRVPPAIDIVARCPLTDKFGAMAGVPVEQVGQVSRTAVPGAVRWLGHLAGALGAGRHPSRRTQGGVAGTPLELIEHHPHQVGEGPRVAVGRAKQAGEQAVRKRKLDVGHDAVSPDGTVVARTQPPGELPGGPLPHAEVGHRHHLGGQRIVERLAEPVGQRIDEVTKRLSDDQRWLAHASLHLTPPRPTTPQPMMPLPAGCRSAGSARCDRRPWA